MRNLLYLVLMSSFFGVAQTPTISFDFNGDLTSTVANVSLVPNGGVPSYTYDRFGNPNGACDIYSTANEIQLEAYFSSTILPYTNNSRSISFWVHYVGHNTTDGNQVNLFRQGAPSGSGSIFSLRQVAKSVYFLGNGVDVLPANKDVYRFDIQNWYHYVVTFNGTEIAIYRNGNLIAQEVPSPTNTNLVTSNTSFIINPTGSVNTVGYGFVIDDLDIYNITLTEQDVHDMYLQDSPLNQNQLLGHFPFNQSTAFFDVTSSPSAHVFGADGTTPAPTLWYGYDDLGLHFTSGEIFSNSTLLAGIDGSFTVAYWQKRNQLPAQSYETSVELGASAFDRAYYTSNAHRDNFGLAVGPNPNWHDKTTPQSQSSGIAESYIRVGEWQHHAMVFDTLNYTLAYYIDGELREKIGVTADQAHFFTNKMTLGGGTDGNGTVQSVKSCTDFDLDELYLFARPLSQPEIMALRYQHATYIPCPTGDVTLTTQQEVNNLWNCSHITGNLIIDDGIASNITDLSPLDGIVTIDGDLVIQNLDIYSITPFDGLTDLGGSFIFQNNDSMIGLGGFNSLTNVPGDFLVESNPELMFLHGFNSLEKIGTDSNLGELRIVDNPDFNFILDYSTLDTITGGLTIQNAPAIDNNITGFFELDFAGSLKLENTGFISLLAFSNLTSLGNGIQLIENDNLLDLSGLDNVSNFSYTNGIFELSGNDLIEDIDELTGLNFNSLKSILVDNNISLLNINGLSGNSGDLGADGSLTISNNPSLTSLAGLDQITGTSELTILNNNAISSLVGLNGLTHTNASSVNSGIVISENQALSSIGGLLNLTIIAPNCPLIINGNTQLVDITSLNTNLDVSTLSSVEIQNNSMLSICNELWLCDYLSGSNVNATILNNAPGCSSQLELSQACGVGLNEEIGSMEISIYPNPTRDEFYVLLSNGSIESVIVLDLSGTKVQENKEEKVVITDLPAGMYYVQVTTTNNQISTQKLVKL